MVPKKSKKMIAEKTKITNMITDFLVKIFLKLDISVPVLVLI